MAMDWQVFCKTTDDATVMATCFGKGGDITYLQWMFHAWGWTLSVAACAWVIAVVVGAFVGTVRTLPNSPWAVRIANAWVELFRNIPILVQLFLWYFVLPKIFPPMKQVPGFLLVVFALGFFTSARIAELTMFAMQAQEETSRGIEIYLGVTALYALSAFAVNRVFAFIEKRVQIPGFIVAGGTGGH